MNKKRVSVSRLIAFRYISIKSHSHLVSFMSAISIFGLSLGVGILITASSIMNGFDAELRENILGVIPHITVSSRENFEPQQWRRMEESVTTLSNVEAVSPSINAGGVVATSKGSNGVLVNGIEVNSEYSVSVIHNFFISGELANLRDNRWGIALGDSLAKELGVQLGESVDLFSPSIAINPLTPRVSFRSFKVVGIFKVGNQEIDSNLVIANLEAVRALFRIRQRHNGFRIKLRDVLDVDETEKLVSNLLLPGTSTTSWKSQFGAIYENINFSRSIISLMLWLLIMVAAFNLIVSLIMIVKGKTSDIAILRALGASPLMIRGIFIWQGGLIGLIGILFGVILGVIGSFQIGNLAAYVEKLFSITLLNADVYPIDFLPSQLSMFDVGGVVAGVLLLSILATIYPSSKAASTPPAESLRSL